MLCASDCCVNIYFYVCVSIMVPVCVVCGCVWREITNLRTSKSYAIWMEPSVNMTVQRINHKQDIPGTKVLGLDKSRFIITNKILLSY